MSIFDVLKLLGGLAMFLYGMRLMGDSLKQNSSGALKRAMEKVTNNPVKAFFLGLLVTALIQSSTATIVITSGLVGAGLLTLHQSLGIIIGANVGTTVTGQIIRLLDLDTGGGVSWLRFLQPSTLAPAALILGMVLIMAGRMKNAKSIGNISIGFGILFSGLLNMTGAVTALSESGLVERLFSGLGTNPVLGYVTGAGVAFALQSSSATIGILQAFASTGMLTFSAIYAVIVGVYLGDCVTTAIVCSIGAKPEAKRVGIVNILYNLSKSVLVLLGVTLVHKFGLLDALWNRPVNSGIIANANTIFNLGCAACLLPMIGVYEKLSRRIVKDETVEKGKYDDRLEALSPVFFSTPALALNSCYDLLCTMLQAAQDNIDRAFLSLTEYSAGMQMEIQQEEDEIDRMTDRISRYTVELMPHLKTEEHVNILNQYHKVANEAEHLGDSAVNIVDIAQGMAKTGTRFSEDALEEFSILKELLDQILGCARQAFREMDMDAAVRIEPLVQVTEAVITQLKSNHFRRMSIGVCNLTSDASFSNFMVECKSISDVCSNIGIAVIVRARPEIADHRHLYYEELQKGGDEMFDAEYDKAYTYYFDLLRWLKSPGRTPAEAVQAPAESV